MPEGPEGTVSFQRSKDGQEAVRAILEAVYNALKEKGYNPINQLVGYMISGDPAYITSYKDARNLICKVERDEILEVLFANYLEK
ncbi:MAG: IreB family regulatory phosphoprotein [Syntrophothermus sp.]|uniref:IreB family regulatory phosphoprotein n=1 Tax=Syntrophothermus sp. TaxID=2736299 RepID=UPI00257F2ECF|nr:IreB family regulatory phosphoprotein [Syntrophothermus sp.]NSW81809.1 IreB family regulatory phosphoprotein [Syntrophothermus sp.]